MRTPPPAYDDKPSEVPHDENTEEDSKCRTICQIGISLIAFGIAAVWSYYYVLGQSAKVPFNAQCIAQLVFLILYLIVLGFFVCTFSLRVAFPFMRRLGDYATHDAGKFGRVLAILGVFGTWFMCVLWIVGLPLIPCVGGIIVRNRS